MRTFEEKATVVEKFDVVAKYLEEVGELPASLGCASKIFMLPFSARPPRVCLYESVPICSHMMFTISSCPVIGGVQGCEIHENIPPTAPVGALVELFVARSHASPKQVPSNCPLLHATEMMKGHL